MLWELSLHQRVSVTKLTVGYKNVDDDSFLFRENLPINQNRLKNHFKCKSSRLTVQFG